jgi:hypothetical protein
VRGETVSNQEDQEKAVKEEREYSGAVKEALDKTTAEFEELKADNLRRGKIISDQYDESIRLKKELADAQAEVGALRMRLRDCTKQELSLLGTLSHSQNDEKFLRGIIVTLKGVVDYDRDIKAD